MTFDVLTIGIVCADVLVRPVESLPERGKLSLVPQLELHLGGLAGVTATVYCQLGGKAAFIGHLGRDGFGDYALNLMREQGVGVDYVKRSDAEGTSATVVLISGDGERTFLHKIGANAEVTDEDVSDDMLRETRVLHWGGPSVTPGLDGAPIGRLFERAHALGVKTSIDTCFDGTGVWFPNIEQALPHTDIMMSSIEEARHFTGQEQAEDIAAFYADHGVDTVMIKMGGDGMYVLNRTEAHHLPSHNVPVVDTTGAGDAACAGFLYGYNEGWNLLECGRLANAVGGLTVQHIGGAEAITSLEATMAFGSTLALAASEGR